MTFVLHFRARPIRRPVAVVAVTQRQLNAALWSWLTSWWPKSSRPPPLPDNLRRDFGLEPLPRKWSATPHHPLDPISLHWRQ